MEPTPAYQTPLTARELAWVLLKILGLYWVVSAVLMIPNVLALGNMTDEQYGGIANSEAIYTTQLLTAVFIFGIGGTLLFATRSVLRLLEFAPREPGSHLTTSGLQAVGFSLVGAWLLAYAIPNVAATAVVLLALSKGGREMERTHYIEANWRSFLPVFFEALVGLWLLFGARRLSASWHRQKRSKDDTELS